MDEKTEKPKTARSLAPGTIDNTRKNIGPIDPQEAMVLSKKLGGEVLPERSVPPNPSTLPKRHSRPEVIRASGRSASDIAAQSASLSAISSHQKSSPSVNQMMSGDAKKQKTSGDLPAISAKEIKLMNKAMMSSEYAIKPDFGLFNFIYHLNVKNRERVSKAFTEYSVKKHVEHMQAFITTIKSFIQLSPDVYKSKIATEVDLKFRFLRTVGKWTMHDIKKCANDIENTKSDITVSMLIPFVRSIYKELITVYYIGEQQVPALIKEIYADIIELPDTEKKIMQKLAKQGITEWLYVYNQIFKGMYPLLMRMCSSVYVEFPQFFTSQIAEILQFLNLTRFDLLLPEKKKKVTAEANTKKEVEKKKEKSVPELGVYDEVVETGLKILEQLFPQAGFLQLEKHPDMFPYFQPLYHFKDGFNILNPENGLQVTIVLIKILEDLFHGCHNIEFTIESDEKLSALPDSLSAVMNDWVSYREVLFDKYYGDYLRNFVNQLYSQSDYANSQFGKDAITNILWRTKYYFLPNFEFTQLLLKKPANDNSFKPLYMRTDYMRTVFTELVHRIDENIEQKTPVLGLSDPWKRYTFDLPNTVSKRLDVLLGAKRDEKTTNATNASLIKYTLCIISVLDWWINNKKSPAYTSDPMHIYRISEKDGGPAFSAPERNDQNQLFADSVKRAVASQK